MPVTGSPTGANPLRAIAGVPATPTVSAAQATPGAGAAGAGGGTAPPRNGARSGSGGRNGSQGGANGGKGSSSSGGSFSASATRSEVVSSVPTLQNISYNLKHLAVNFSIALLFILLSWFPSEIINSVMKEHHHVIVRRFGRWERLLHRADEVIHALPTPIMFGAFALLGGLIYGFLDPNFGFNQTSLLLLGGIAAELVLITLAHELIRGWYVRRRLNVAFELRTFPVGILFAVALVLFSRLAHFEPGYTFGLVCGVLYRGTVHDREDGRSLAVATVAPLDLAIGTWLAWIPVRHAAMGAHAGGQVLFLDAMLAFVWVFAIQTVVFSLVPLRFLDGEKIMKWRRMGWLTLYAVGMFVFVETLVHPSAKYGGNSNATFWSMLVIFLAFTGLAIVFWAWFRFERWKSDREPGAPPPPPLDGRAPVGAS